MNRASRPGPLGIIKRDNVRYLSVGAIWHLASAITTFMVKRLPRVSARAPGAGRTCMTIYGKSVPHQPAINRSLVIRAVQHRRAMFRSEVDLSHWQKNNSRRARFLIALTRIGLRDGLELQEGGATSVMAIEIETQQIESLRGLEYLDHLRRARLRDGE